MKASLTITVSPSSGLFCLSKFDSAKVRTLTAFGLLPILFWPVTEVSALTATDLLDERVRCTRLFDLYGPVLTEKQRKAFELHQLLDWSLSEVASDLGVSRQGACDLVQRARERLRETDSLLDLARRIDALEGRLSAVSELAARWSRDLPEAFVEALNASLADEEEEESRV